MSVLFFYLLQMEEQSLKCNDRIKQEYNIDYLSEFLRYRVGKSNRPWISNSGPSRKKIFSSSSCNRGWESEQIRSGFSTIKERITTAALLRKKNQISWVWYYITPDIQGICFTTWKTHRSQGVLIFYHNPNAPYLSDLSWVKLYPGSGTLLHKQFLQLTNCNPLQWCLSLSLPLLQNLKNKWATRYLVFCISCTLLRFRDLGLRG